MSKSKRPKKIAPSAAPVDSVASDIDVASDTVAAIGAPPDAPTAVPARLRTAVGNAAHVSLSDVHPALTFNGILLNGYPAAPRVRDPLCVAPLLAPLTAADAPALYARAAMLVASASVAASVNAPNRIGASPLDRMQFLARAAERCIYAADRARDGKRPVRAFSGGFNGTDPTRMRLASLAACADLPTVTDTIPADACDAAIVAYLAERKTATRPNGGYFARNVGTIDR